MKSVAIDSMSPESDDRLKIEWQFTKMCNFDCSYCSKYTHDNISPWRDISECKIAVDKLVESVDKEIWLSFTGGEPCIYPDFQELLMYCKERGIYFTSVCSNGSRSSEYYCNLMDYLDSIIISYHFEYKVNVLDSILAIRKKVKHANMLSVHVMMLPGHFEKAMNAMKILEDNDVLFRVRRIRPLYMPDGSPAKPYQKGGDLKLTKNGPDYSGDQGYYSDKELDFFGGKLHEYK